VGKMYSNRGRGGGFRTHGSHRTTVPRREGTIKRETIKGSNTLGKKKVSQSGPPRRKRQMLKVLEYKKTEIEVDGKPFKKEGLKGGEGTR